MPDLIGKTLSGRYRVEAFLGKGGMAEVYKVWDVHRSAYLAMKLLHEDLALDNVFLRRFKREAQTLARLQHPNIVRFYGMEQEDRLVFMLMDYVDGESLKHKIFDAHGPLPFDQIMAVMRPLCQALQYAHNEGLVHADVKPGNIMIDKTGRVLLSDFGIAHMSESATATMVGAGTPAYMSPEQARGEMPTPQTDIYALGIVLYEMLTGERPFTGELANISGSTGEKIRWEQLNLNPLSPRQYNSAISPKLEAVVMKCLQKNPDKRYAGILQFLKAVSDANVEASPEDSIVSNTMIRENRDEKNGNKQDHVRARRRSYVKRNKSSAKNSFELNNNSIRWMGIAVVVIVIVTLIWLEIGDRQNKLNQLAEAHVEQTRIADQVTSTAVAQGTASAKAATATSDAAQAETATFIAKEMTATAQAEAATEQVRMAVQSTAESLVNHATTVFGPESGTLVHDPNSNHTARSTAHVLLRNFIADVKVYNPYSVTENPWSYSIDFRETYTDHAFYLYVSSNSNWELTLDDSGSWSTVSKGVLRNLDTSTNGSNQIRLIVSNDVAILYVNGELVDTLDISGNASSGDVSLVVGQQVQGKVTRYSDFTVWNISSGSATNTAAASATSALSLPAGPYKATITINSALRGKAPLNVNLGVNLQAANGQYLCNPTSECSYTWSIFKADSNGNFGDFITTFHSDYFGSSFDPGNYFITVNVCLTGSNNNCAGNEVYVSVTK